MRVVTKKIDPGFLKHFLYVFGSQLVVLLSGFVKALLVPLLLGLSDYAYWQIYVFYTVYIGVFTLGYGDGLYLKYGGYKIADLPLNCVRTANAMYLAMLAIGAAALVAFAYANTDPYRQVIFFAVAANVVIVGITANISLTLQATNQLKGYAFLNSADKVFFTLALIALFQDNFRTFEYLILADIGAKIFVMAILLYRYRHLFIGPLTRFSIGATEFGNSIGAGIQLMLANLMGMLVLGVGRIILEYFDTLDSYAHYAFAVSLANVVLMSVTALSIVIYPSLKRQAQENYLVYFNKTNAAYAAFALVMLAGYFPAIAFIDLFARQYLPVIDFLNAIFVITVLQGKMQLVNNTYYKALRLERPMLVANASSLLIATVLSAAGFMLTESILAIAYAALFTMLIRVYSSEIFLRRHMSKLYDLRFLAEPLVLGIFILTSQILSPAWGATVWLLFLAGIALRNRVAIDSLWRQLRSSTR